MAEDRNCKHCGKKISLRKMPNGKWVAFEGYDTRHDCRNPHKATTTSKSSNETGKKTGKARQTFAKFSNDDLDFIDFVLPGEHQKERDRKQKSGFERTERKRSLRSPILGDVNSGSKTGITQNGSPWMFLPPVAIFCLFVFSSLWSCTSSLLQSRTNSGPSMIVEQQQQQQQQQQPNWSPGNNYPVTSPGALPLGEQNSMPNNYGTDAPQGYLSRNSPGNSSGYPERNDGTQFLGSSPSKGNFPTPSPVPRPSALPNPIGDSNSIYQTPTGDGTVKLYASQGAYVQPAEQKSWDTQLLTPGITAKLDTKVLNANKVGCKLLINGSKADISKMNLNKDWSASISLVGNDGSPLSVQSLRANQFKKIDPRTLAFNGAFNNIDAQLYQESTGWSSELHASNVFQEKQEKKDKLSTNSDTLAVSPEPAPGYQSENSDVPVAVPSSEPSPEPMPASVESGEITQHSIQQLSPINKIKAKPIATTIEEKLRVLDIQVFGRSYDQGKVKERLNRLEDAIYQNRYGENKIEERVRRLWKDIFAK